MPVRNHAPQAYTKEVLTSAFDWLSVQEPGVQEQIQSSDDLVALYLKATRLNQDAVAQSTNAKKFRDELQGLAKDIEAFEERPPSVPVMPKISQMNIESTVPHVQRSQPVVPTPRPVAAPPIAQMRVELPTEPQKIEVQIPTPKPVAVDKVVPQAMAPEPTIELKEKSLKQCLEDIDEKTNKSILFAKNHLNLSCELEALRVLVQLGEKQLRKF